MADTKSKRTGKRVKVSNGPDISGDTVSLTGSDGATIQVHKQLLMKNSAFAAARFSGRWDTIQPGILSLAEFSSAHLTIYVQWLYSGRLHTMADEPEENGVIDAEWDCMLDLYLIGEYLQTPSFCNQVMRGMCHKSVTTWVTLTDHAYWIYPRTSGGSPLRKFLVDMHVYYGRCKFLANDLEILDLKDPYRSDFLADIVAEMLLWKDGPYGSEHSEWPRFEGEWVDRYMLPEDSDASKIASTDDKPR